MRRRLFLVGVVVLLVATACGGHSPPRNAASHTPVPNTRIVPRHITVAYVDAVFVKLNHIYGDAVRSAVKAGHLSSAAIKDIRSIYNNPFYTREVQAFEASIRHIPSDIRRPPGDEAIEVDKLIYARHSCIFLEARVNYSKVLRRPPAPVGRDYLMLKPKMAASLKEHINPTPWAISLDIIYKGRHTVQNQCTLSS